MSFFARQTRKLPVKMMGMMGPSWVPVYHVSETSGRHEVYSFYNDIMEKGRFCDSFNVGLSRLRTYAEVSQRGVIQISYLSKVFQFSRITDEGFCNIRVLLPLSKGAWLYCYVALSMKDIMVLVTGWHTILLLSYNRIHYAYSHNLRAVK